MLLEDGGTEALDYAPEDLALYDRMSAEMKAMQRDGRLMNRATGDMSQEYTRLWRRFEQLRNRYNGMPPRQLSAVQQL